MRVDRSPAGRTAALLGYGRSNAALLDFLLTRRMTVTVRDRNPVTRALPKKVILRTGEAYLADLHEDVLFRSPGLRPDLLPIRAAVSRGAELSGEYDLFASLCPATLLAVTGSSGKTTTVTLCGLMLSAAGHRAYVGGNIGHPLIADLSAMGARDFAVAELSSFQLMTAPTPPARAVITNISENHLNWHHGMEEYIAAKNNILGQHTHAVLPAEGAYTAPLARARKDKTLFSLSADRATLLAAFGMCHTVTLADGAICYDGCPLLFLHDILLPGRHNILNYMAAIGLVYPYLPGPDAIRQVARTFHGVAHRMEKIGTRDGVTYYNSSIDSTPSRTAATLDALDTRPILLCGGQEKGLSLSPLREAARTHAKCVILFGEARVALYEALSDLPIPCHSRATMEEAVQLSMKVARAGDTVLLSPACTSFDEFTDFAERGEAFRHAVLDP